MSHSSTSPLVLALVATFSVAPLAQAQQPAPFHAASSSLVVGAQLSPLDAVLDTRRADDKGAQVLAVTPGGNADRMGMRVGDRVLIVNGRSLVDSARPSAALDEALAQQGPIKATVSRDGQTVELRADAQAATSIASTPTGCGYISNHGSLPHVSDRLYPVQIVSIDGGGNPIDANRHRLPAGMHVVTLSERIENIRFDPLQQRAREQLFKREGIRADKTLVIDVKPGTRHLLGARFLDKDLDGNRIRENEYWEPVVWREIPDACR